MLAKQTSQSEVNAATGNVSEVWLEDDEVHFQIFNDLLLNVVL